jgi:predicted amidohydrolase YtcJ
MVAIGTDFPVEFTDPFRTIHSAVQRKNADDFPGGGFIPNEALTLDQTIKGMTIWAAYAAFQEDHLGTIEKGKDATLSIFDKPVTTSENYQPNFAYMTFIKGKKVYSVE